MAVITYFVALAFKRSEDGAGDEIVACDPTEARSSEEAIRLAGSLARTEGHCGAIAFSRTGDPALGDFEDAVVLKTFGDVDVGAAAGLTRLYPLSCSRGWMRTSLPVIQTTGARIGFAGLGPRL